MKELKNDKLEHIAGGIDSLPVIEYVSPLTYADFVKLVGGKAREIVPCNGML